MAAIVNSVMSVLGLNWLVGPIFGKELRVSSRRRRNYWLRFAYVVLLAGFAVMVWLAMIGSRRSGTMAVQISRMAEAGKAIIVMIVWFQFIGLQLLAIVLLSTAINEELYYKTLGVLMTTPINSFQIVMGKLLSKLLQLMILLGISLPLLAVVRVFGGVPWDFVVQSVCITFTAVVFVGAWSLLYSIFCRRAYVVILATAFTLVILYAFLPWIVFIIMWKFSSLPNAPPIWLLVGNPFFLLIMNTQTMMGGMSGGVGFGLFGSWVHCLMMLGGSSVLLALSVAKVRRVALRQAVGRGSSGTKKLPKSNAAEAPAAVSEGAIRRVSGMPIVWKELKTPLYRRKGLMILGWVFCGLIIGLTYVMCAWAGGLEDKETHMIYCGILVAVAILHTAVVSATMITSEKESRSWPILLATPLSSWEILWGKAVGAFRRCTPAWGLLLGHVAVFTVFGIIHPVAIFQIALVMGGLLFLLIGSGLFFSVRFKRSTTAVVMNVGFVLFLWAIMPIVLGLAGEISGGGDDMFETYITGHPLVQAVVIMEATAGRRGRAWDRGLENLDYDWPEINSDGVVAATFILGGFALVNTLIGVGFAYWGKRRLRKNLF